MQQKLSALERRAIDDEEVERMQLAVQKVQAGLTRLFEE